MTLKELELRIKDLSENTPDPETAHIEEDNIRAEVLREVVRGNPDSKEMARQALDTKLIEFSRWYA